MPTENHADRALAQAEQELETSARRAEQSQRIAAHTDRLARQNNISAIIRAALQKPHPPHAVR